MALLTPQDYLRFPQAEADHRYSYGPHPLQFGELTLPQSEPPHPVILLIHGGCYRELYDLRPISAPAAAMAEAGFAVWNIEYRRHGNGGAFPQLFHDVAKAADHLRKIASAHQLDLDRVHGMGHSAGGHLALWLAGRPGIDEQSSLFVEHPIAIKSVIALAPLADIRRAAEQEMCGDALPTIMGGVPDDAPANYRAASPRQLLPLGAPQILIVGDQDQGILENVRPYVEAAREAGDELKFILLPDAGHFEVLSVGSHAWHSLRRVLDDLRRAI